MLFDQPQLACPECDVLLNTAPVKVGQKLECPRCGFVLRRPQRDVINRALALSLTTLILIVPANILPMMSWSMLGLNNVDTMVKGVMQLYLQGYWWMAFLVLVCSMLAPLLESLLVAAICIMVKANLFNRLMARMLIWPDRGHHRLLCLAAADHSLSEPPQGGHQGQTGRVEEEKSARGQVIAGPSGTTRFPLSISCPPL